MEIKKLIFFIVGLMLQLFIYVKEQEKIKALENELAGLFCNASLQESKILMICVLIVTCMVARHSLIELFLMFFIGGIIALQLLRVYDIISVNVLILDNVFISVHFLASCYLVYIISRSFKKVDD